MKDYLLIGLIAAALEAFMGYPHWLERLFAHPVVWVGRFISFCDEKFNHGTPQAKSRAGIMVAAWLLLVPFLMGRGIEWGLGVIFPHFLKILILALFATCLIAQNSLFYHVKAVLDALECGDMALARVQIAKIVGRDCENLEASDIARAAIETLSESFCDGVIAPIFWICTFGLGGGMAFKAISTADSMIGHMDDKYRDFGRASARLDDILNYIPARIAGLLICMMGGGFKIMWRDNAKHQSPNSAWSEAAMAGALGCRIGGGAFYDGEYIARPHLGDGGEPEIKDLHKALYIYIRACGLALILVGGLVWILR